MGTDVRSNFPESRPPGGTFHFFMGVGRGGGAPPRDIHIFKSAFPYPLERKFNPYRVFNNEL